MAKQKYQWLDRRIARTGPFLTLCLTPEEMEHAAKGLTKWPLTFPQWGANVQMFSKDGTNEHCAVVTLAEDSQKNCNSVEIAGMLVHEAVHIWQYYAEKMGETKPGDEQEAYAVQGLTQELLAEYARRLNEGTAPQPKAFFG